MLLRGSAAVLRQPAQWARGASEARLDEDWTLVLLGVVVLVATLGLGAAAAWTVHQRDAAMANATTVAQRLAAGGLDERLYQDLITMQQDEVKLFDARVDPGQAGQGQNPATDLNTINSDLALLKAQFTGSPQVQRDITLISREMAPYTAAEASALDYNQQGLPVGGSYLRAASGYLTAYTLPAADNIRLADENQVRADDATASAVPWALLAVAAAALAGLVGVQILLARRTRCQFDPWLLLATAVAVVLIAWPVTALSASANAVSHGTSPHAREASVLAQALVDGITAGNDDQLTLADHDEDCSGVNPRGNTFVVTCSFEQQVLRSLTFRTLRNGLLADLTRATAGAPAREVTPALAETATWASDETNLPTLQNLEAKATREGVTSAAFGRFRDSYTKPPANVGRDVTRDFGAVQSDVQSAIGYEWTTYDDAAAGAGGTLNGAVTGAVLLALLAAAAGGLGIGLRVAEYWSPGGRAA